MVLDYTTFLPLLLSRCGSLFISSGVGDIFCWLSYLSHQLPSHFSCVWFCATPSLGFSRQEDWSGLPFPSPMHKSEKWKWSRSVMSDSSRPHGLQPTRLLRPWDFPGKKTGVGCHCLLRSLSRCNFSVPVRGGELKFFLLYDPGQIPAPP